MPAARRRARRCRRGSTGFADPPDRATQVTDAGKNRPTAGQRFRDQGGAQAAQSGGKAYTDLINRVDFPRFVALAETGRLDLGTMVSRRIHLHEVNDAFRAMEAGEVIRSVICD